MYKTGISRKRVLHFLLPSYWLHIRQVKHFQATIGYCSYAVWPPGSDCRKRKIEDIPFGKDNSSTDSQTWLSFPTVVIKAIGHLWQIKAETTGKGLGHSLTQLHFRNMGSREKRGWKLLSLVIVIILMSRVYFPYFSKK